MDITDKKILKALQADAGMTTKELASIVNMSSTPVYERVKRLQRNGVLSYKVLIDRKKLGYSLIVFGQVSLINHNIETIRKFEKHIMDLPEVVESYHTAGSFDYLLKIMVKDMQHYQDFLVNKLSVTKVMSNIQSVFVMKEEKFTLDVALD